MSAFAPTLPGAPPDAGSDPSQQGGGPAPDSDTPEEDLQDAAKEIAAIKPQGNGYLVTFDDGQEFVLRPGDAHVLGPIGTDTMFHPGDGSDPVSFLDAHKAGDLPADLHRMVAVSSPPTAAEAGMVAPAADDDAAPEPQLPGLPPRKAA